jgi:HSP20 family protein
MASLIKWEPFGDLISLRDAMDRLFEDSFVRMRGWPTVFGAEALAIDMYETKDSIVVKTALPGVKPEEVDITITGDVLTIKGEAKAEEKIEKQNYIRQERRYGLFQRSVQLPGSLVTDKAKANFEHGVLTITIPKSEEAKPKTIKVEAKQS